MNLKLLFGILIISVAFKLGINSDDSSMDSFDYFHKDSAETSQIISTTSLQIQETEASSTQIQMSSASDEELSITKSSPGNPQNRSTILISRNLFFIIATTQLLKIYFL